MKRIVALFLSFVIMLNSLPLQVFAEDAVIIDDPEIIQQIIEGETDILTEETEPAQEELATQELPQAEQETETEVEEIPEVT
ncbi:MAG: hypothetical protein IJD80_07930, partial [Oscillospiraceae bacterium]|nr:hypothetical protein [Oscillospiraceae bacterium]